MLYDYVCDFGMQNTNSEVDHILCHIIFNSLDY